MAFQFFLTLFIFFTNYRLILCLRCHYCSINDLDPLSKIVSCRNPGLWHCPTRFDSCINVIYRNTITRRCITPNTTGAKLWLERCDKARKVKEENCKICTADLCNAAVTNSPGSFSFWVVFIFSCVKHVFTYLYL